MPAPRFKPTGYTGTSGTLSNPTYAYDDDILTRAHLYHTVTKSKSTSGTTYTATAYTYYTMDFSSIPPNAIIKYVRLVGRLYVSCSATNYKAPLTKNAYFDVYDGSTRVQRETITDVTSVSNISFSLSNSMNIRLWLGSSDPKVRFYATCSGKASTTSKSTREANLYLYDLYAEVEYELKGVTIKTKVSGEWVESTPLVKADGEWVEPSNAFVKVNGSWEEVI